MKRNNYVRLMAIKHVNVACADNMTFAGRRLFTTNGLFT